MSKFIYLFNLLFKIILIPVYFILIAISPLVHVVFIQISTEKFGHFIEDTFLQHITVKKYFKFKGFFNIKILYGKRYVSNKELLNLWRQIYFFTNKFWFLENLRKVFKYFDREEEFFLTARHNAPYTYILKNEKVPYKFPKKFNKAGEDLLEKLEIPKKSNWICVASRSNTFDIQELKKTNKDGITIEKYISNNQFRNFNLNKIEVAINKFLEKDYFVIDMSYENESSIKIKNKKFINFYRNKYSTELGDIYLLTMSKMYFGADSGVNNFHRILNKPQVVMSTAELTSYLLGWFFNKSLLVPKLIYSKQDKIFTLNDMKKNDLYYKPPNFKLNFSKLKYRENTQDEIENAAIEILYFLENGHFKLDSEDQENIKKLRMFIKSMLPNSIYSKMPLASFNFLISPYFLKKHRYILD